MPSKIVLLRFININSEIFNKTWNIQYRSQPILTNHEIEIAICFSLKIQNRTISTFQDQYSNLRKPKFKQTRIIASELIGNDLSKSTENVLQAFVTLAKFCSWNFENKYYFRSLSFEVFEKTKILIMKFKTLSSNKKSRLKNCT